MKTNKYKNKIRIVIISIFIIFGFSTPIFARYYELLEKFTGKATIAEPIIRVEALQDTIEKEINKETNLEEYYFLVKNYEIDANANKRINEVNFIYDIEIKNSSENFPIKYELYDIETGEDLLNGENKVLRTRNYKKRRI